MKSRITIIVPVYNESGNITHLISEIKQSIKDYSSLEIIFVDDGSTDNTLEILKIECLKDSSINYLSLSRNFGHQNALRAGLEYSKGDAVITMDGDLQHPPTLLPELIKKWEEGYDIVNTLRVEDKSVSYFKRKSANLFYKIISKVSEVQLKEGSADFRLIDRKIVDILKNFTENNLFIRGMISWLGFKQYYIEYTPDKRFWGTSKYTLKKMFKLGISGLTSFSVSPLHISTTIGYIIAFIAFIYGIYAVYMRVFTSSTLSGWTSVLTAILFIGGIQLIMIGILGEYVGRIFIESKKRPNYIIKEKSL